MVFIGCKDNSDFFKHKSNIIPFCSIYVKIMICFFNFFVIINFCYFENLTFKTFW